MPTKKELEIYGDLVYEYKPTIRSLLVKVLEAKLFNLRRSKTSIYQQGAVFIPEHDKLKHLPLQYIALVRDNTVEEMIRINEETAEILMSDDVTFIPFNPSQTVVQKGFMWDEENGFYISGESNEQKDQV